VTAAVAVVVVTHNSAAVLDPPPLDAGDEAVFVDNASSDGTPARARELGLRVIESGGNIGFPAACRLGAQATSAPLLLFLNPDARLEPGALARLRAVADERPGWAAWQPAVILPDGRINTAGGVVHYLGVGSTGRFGQDAATLPREPYETAFASGAALVIRREAWDALGGMRDDYWLYGEDVDLGLRLWLAGLRVGVEPRARVVHDYEFDKGARKWFLLERNRWRTVLAVYPAALLALLAPALLAAELGLLAVAARGGWLGAKLRAQAATVGGLPRALRRRRAVQRGRRIRALEFAEHLDAGFESPFMPLPRPLALLASVYWRLTLAVLRAG